MNKQRGAFSIGGVIMSAMALIFLGVGFITYQVALSGVDAAIVTTGTQVDVQSIAIGDINYGNVTLTKRLFNDDTGNIISVTSNGTNPTVNSTFTHPGLYFTFITGNATHVITSTYPYSAVADMSGLSATLPVMPLIVLVSFLSGAVVTGYMGIRMIVKGA